MRIHSRRGGGGRSGETEAWDARGRQIRQGTSDGSTRGATGRLLLEEKATLLEDEVALQVDSRC
jgi:hypothetical protein